MQSLTTTTLFLLSSAASLASANTYTLYCGSSCADASNAVSQGSNYAGAACTAFDTGMPYCHLVADVAQYKAIVSKGASCEGGAEEQVVWPGECFEGPWDSFQVAVNL